MPEVTTLTGFREDQLEMQFESAWRLSFTLVEKRSDDTPLDMDLVWTYTINGTVRLKGRLRTLEEQISPNEDFQRYELTDGFDDVSREPFLRDREYPDSSSETTARFAFNDERYTGEENLEDALNAIVNASSILTGTTFVDPVPSSVLIEKNIQVEGRSIGEMLTQILKFGPAWRWYYDSLNDKAKFIDLTVVKQKEIRLSKLVGQWHLRTPKWDNLVKLNLRIDKSDCYEKIRLEGLGRFRYRPDVQLLPGWFSQCIEAEHKPACFNLVEPYFPEEISGCPPFACRYLFPNDIRPAAFSFKEEDGKFSVVGDNQIVVMANIPKRNLGRCKEAEDYPGGEIPEGVDPHCEKQETPWEWADFELVEVATITPPADKNSCGEYVVSFCPKRLMSMLPFWSPEGSEHVDEYPTDPKILVWDLFANLWEDLGELVVVKTGGCPNGRVYQRYNIDWVKILDQSGGVVRDDEAFLIDFADQLMEQIGRPKVSGEIQIHLHPRHTGTGDESYTRPDIIPYIDYLGIELGDSINVMYDPTETFGVDPYPDGKGVVPDAGPAGTDLTWETMDLRVMGMSFNRAKQSLVLRVANSPFIFGDRPLTNLQR